ncbi:MAG TPA: TetR family transcriptional regulator [Pseudonocardiaceae bacterium]|nr:TetR family transcriptional regulator [Pseudonocardiaceae bacterium]
MGEQVVGRRERKKQATRVALSAAALRLSIERGIDNVTVEQIADEADVSMRTFFNYFSSKEEAIVAGDVATAESLVDAFRGRPAGEPVLEALRHAVLAVLDEDSYRDRVQRMQTLRRTPSLLPHQIAAFVARERALAAAVADRIGCNVDQDLYPALVAASAMAGLRVAVQRWLGEPSPEGPVLRELMMGVIDQLAAGLTAPLAATAPS